MIKQLFSNNGISLLKNDISNNSLTIEVNDGSVFPNPGHNEYFLVTLEDVDNPLSREIVKVIQRVGNLLFVSDRGYESTDARSWDGDENTLVDNRLTAGTIASLNNTGPSSKITLVPAASSVVVSSITLTTRSYKLWVTVSNALGFASTFEVLILIQGLTGSESVEWTKHNRLGKIFSGELDIVVNSLNNNLDVYWNNLEQNDVEVKISYLPL